MEGATPSDVYHFLLLGCHTFRFAPPWDFLSTQHGDVYASLVDPDYTLRLLRTSFTPAQLISAALVEENAGQGLRLRPELCNPAGALVSLLSNLDGSVIDLLTPRGFLRRKVSPFSLAHADLRTTQGIKDTALVLVCFNIHDVIFFRTLGWPAVLGLGSHKLVPEMLRALDANRGSQDHVVPLPAPRKEATAEAARQGRKGSTPPQAGPATDGKAAPPTGAAASGKANDKASPVQPGAQGAGERATPSASSTAAQPGGPNATVAESETAQDPIRITCVFICWSPVRMRFAYAPQVARVASSIAEARRFLGLDLAAFLAWQPAQADLENLRYRLRWPTRQLIVEFFGASLEKLQDLETVLGDAAPAVPAADVDFISARANLARCLAHDPRLGELPLDDAQQQYRQAVQRELTAPCLDWALSQHDPVVRSVGIEVATALQRLHELAPLCHAAQAGLARRKKKSRHLEQLEDQYVRLSARLGSLLQTLNAWRNA